MAPKPQSFSAGMIEQIVITLSLLRLLPILLPLCEDS